VALRPVLSNGLPLNEQAQNDRKPQSTQAIRLQRLTLVSQRMSDEPRRLSELFREGPLSRLLREADRRRLETGRIKDLLPTEERAHLLSATTNEAGDLVLVMDSPAWAARVRYCVSALPNARVRIRVLPRGG
jgi:hypothetical protein